MVHVIFIVDENGVLNVATLDPSKGWQGPGTIGNADFVPGSHIAVFKQSATTYTALIVDKNCVLNAASLDLTKGWQGLETIGNASLVPGSPVSVFKQSATAYTALMVDRNGVLNVGHAGSEQRLARAGYYWQRWLRTRIASIGILGAK